MSHRTPWSDASDQDEIYRRLAHHRRRKILSILRREGGTVSEETLATQIDDSASRGSGDDHQRDGERPAVALRHVHLPALADVGLVDWDRDRNEVSTGTHPSVRNDEFPIHHDWLDPAWDSLVSALAHRHRRLLLSIASRRGRLEFDALARSIVEREHPDGANVTVERVRTSLHHTHLPSLEAAGLLEYDDGTVTFVGHSEIDDEWFAFETVDSIEVDTTVVDVPP